MSACYIGEFLGSWSSFFCWKFVLPRWFDFVNLQMNLQYSFLFKSVDITFIGYGLILFYT